MKTMSTTLVTFIEAMVLMLGFSACGATTAQKRNARQISPVTTTVAADEEVTPPNALDAPTVAGSDGSSGPSSSLEPELSEAPEQIVIICNLRVDNPHKSSHVPGTVNVVARFNCTSSVSGIQMTVTLERDGVEVARSPVNSSGSASLRGNAATPCINGTYQGTARAVVTFPPGHWPSTTTLDETSSRIPITC